MKQSVLRFAAQLWAMLAVLLLFVAAALPAHADDGDMDEITHYTVTVDTRADGSADITYELDWNVIGGILCLFMAEVLSLGTQLSEEQKLTI